MSGCWFMSGTGDPSKRDSLIQGGIYFLGLDQTSGSCMRKKFGTARDFDRAELGLNLAKKEIFSRVVDAACEPVIAIVGMVIFRDALKQRRSSAVMKSSWRRLTVRFENFLRQNSLHADDGLLIDSSQKTPEAEIKDIIMAEVRRRGGRLGACRVIKNPIFVKSRRWNLIQLADVTAYVVHRLYRKDPRFEGWFKSLEPKMHRSGGRLYGFGINEIPDSH